MKSRRLKSLGGAGMKRRRLTSLGKAYRASDAYVATAWEHDYKSALVDAATGRGPERLLRLLRAYRPLVHSDFDQLADWIETLVPKPKQRPRDELVHYVYNLCKTVFPIIRSQTGGKLSDASRDATIDKMIEAAVREIDEQDRPELADLFERVLNLLRR
jgi:hypothetical protein